jgi:AraC family mar-sox-rob regulon transcriptional activator
LVSSALIHNNKALLLLTFSVRIIAASGVILCILNLLQPTVRFTMAQDLHLSVVNALSLWIESHLGRVIHLEELAEYSGYSLWHMQKLFKEATGISLGKYIRERRLAGAVYQLTTSSTSIFDIAMDFGFGSQSHFTYMFRKRFNITPFEFRQNPTLTLDIAPPLHLSQKKSA